MKCLATDVDGALAIPIRLATGIDAYTQRLHTRFGMVKGEWKLDLRIGSPWFEFVLGQAFDERVIRALVTEIVLKTPETEAVIDMQISHDPATRVATVSNLTVKWAGDGKVHTFQSEKFVVTLGAVNGS